MDRMLILVRHGRAERAQPGMADADRSLTPDGQAALAAPDGFARSFSLLGAEERAAAVIWTSPALRARQTSEAVVAAIGERPVTPLPCLFEQDEEAFLDELRASDAPCVIAVGHIPFMERVAERLCGAELSFSPGAVACIRLDFCPDPFASDLLWFVQGPNT
ncbi:MULTISPECIES: SixA phosphatase family protein [Enorma]|uniref:SixA phosphatase family protein n=1 Tax=Enorma TaxID=1472762 RepID=UPI000347184C|nr:MULTISPECIES: histidine phosphatase family protein [Enorma]